MYFEIKENEIDNNSIHILLNSVLEKPISSINYKGARHFLSLALTYAEYAYLKYDFDGNIQDQQFLSIVQHLKKSRIKSGPIEIEGYSHFEINDLDVNCVCNNVIYLGTDKDGKEHYSNFDNVNNLLVHGDPGSGKTVYLKKIIDGALSKTDLGRLDIIIWSFKPFEFEKNYSNYLIEDQNIFVEVLEEMAKYKNHNTLVVVDELYLFLETLLKSNKEKFINFLKNSREYNLCFLCVSQNMSSLMYDLGEYADTTACFGFHYKENANKMNCDEDEEEPETYGDFYIYNSPEFLLPARLKV